ncbi:MAG: hypothetical protein M5U16_00060 [Hyphomicrobium sp.]|nr:hypothetical protein [Hyphomicrobium sp.]
MTRNRRTPRLSASCVMEKVHGLLVKLTRSPVRRGGYRQYRVRWSAGIRLRQVGFDRGSDPAVILAQEIGVARQGAVGGDERKARIRRADVADQTEIRCAHGPSR